MADLGYQMSMTDQLKLVRDRRLAVEAEIEHLIARISALKAELPDLQVTERTLTRLAAGEHQADQRDTIFVIHPDEVEARKLITPAKLAAALNGGGKPSGIPTTPEMILTLLTEASRRGSRGYEPQELTRAISRRWWPGVKSEEVSPIVWRMWKRGQLRKDGSMYFLPENTEAADLLGEDSAAS